VIRKVYVNYYKAEISAPQEVYGAVAISGSDRFVSLTLQYHRHGSRCKLIIFTDKYVHFSNILPFLIYSEGQWATHFY
jgi:hypothetical protein